jgi:hypothetical protein
VGAGAQQVGAVSQQLLLWPRNREKKPDLPQQASSPHDVAQPPQVEPQEEPVETTAGAGAAATGASAPAIQAEVSMNNAAFTVSNLR